MSLYPSGFSRCARGRDSGAYHHELFLRGKPELAKKLIRTKVKGNGHKTMKLDETDPDFYAMTPVVSEEHKDVVVEPTSTVSSPDFDRAREAPAAEDTLPSLNDNVTLPFRLSSTLASDAMAHQAAAATSNFPNTLHPCPSIAESTSDSSMSNSFSYQRQLEQQRQHQEQQPHALETSSLLQDLNQSIFIHELAMGCTILCQLRKGTNL